VPGRSVDAVLQLQRTAGNQAATLWVQRQPSAPVTFRPSNVALADLEGNFKGKTNASFDSVKVERHWEWGLLYDDIAIVFQCGSQRFRFETEKTGNGVFPWTMLNVKGGAGGWVRDPTKHALQTLYDHWDDPFRFGAATAVVKAELKHDVEQYRLQEQEEQAKRAALGAMGVGMGANLGPGRGTTETAGWWKKRQAELRRSTGR
jgi:hypothetical protein